MSQKTDVPIQFVDSNDEKKHIILLYEDPAYARLIEYRFLKKGLDKGEHCFYATNEDSATLVIRMLSYGIKLEDFKSKKMQVMQVHNRLGSRESMMQSCKKDISDMLDTLKPPFRIVTRIVPNIEDPVAMSVELELEELLHKTFDDIKGSVMCPYDISMLDGNKRKIWLEKLRANHHIMIYAQELGKGSVVSL